MATPSLRIKYLILIPAMMFLLALSPLQAQNALNIVETPAKHTADFSNEKLHYKVLFKWGLINKVAGYADLSLTVGKDIYTAVLTARSASWADHFYSLRDTLTSEIWRSTLTPRQYTRIAHEDGKYVRDRLSFSRTNNIFKAECERTRFGKKDEEPTVTNTSLEAAGMTADFISAFYYLRSLKFDSLLPGYSIVINIFSGKRKELLRLTYQGIDSITINGRKQNAYKVTFTFTSDGKKETSDAIACWLTMNEAKIPLMIEGKLKVGKIRCVLD